MEYALLYTFSTIPQTIAAALGVLAAFVLYRLQSDSNSRWDDAYALITAFGSGDATQLPTSPRGLLSDLLGSQQYDTLIAEIEHRFAGNIQSRGSAIAMHFMRLKASVRARGQILGALRTAFWATGGLILMSVVMLWLAHSIYQDTLTSCFALAVGLLYLLACLFFYWSLLRAALWSE